MSRLAGAKMKVHFHKEGTHQFIAWTLPELSGWGFMKLGALRLQNGLFGGPLSASGLVGFVRSLGEVGHLGSLTGLSQCSNTHP